MIPEWTPIQHREKWDGIPRMVVVSFDRLSLVLDCPFDEAADEYAAHYRVYVIDPPTAAQLDGDWRLLPGLAKSALGTLPITEARFDSSGCTALHRSTCVRLVAMMEGERG